MRTRSQLDYDAEETGRNVSRILFRLREVGPTVDLHGLDAARLN
jgi:hypothetical protein